MEKSINKTMKDKFGKIRYRFGKNTSFYILIKREVTY